VLGMLLETETQLKLNIQSSLFYGIAFFATVLFYNHPYARNYSSYSNNPRSSWCKKNYHFLLINQLLFTVVLCICLVYLSVNYHQKIKNMGHWSWFLLLIFPIIGALYYGNNLLARRHNLRKIGWLKPFIIGFVWAGMSNVYPILYSNLIHQKEYAWDAFSVLLFLKSFMFISMLAILFDIKDYVADSKEELNTLIVKIGLRKTIFYVITPLTILGLLTFISYALIQQFSFPRMILNMIPYLCLLLATRLFKKRRTML